MGPDAAAQLGFQGIGSEDGVGQESSDNHPGLMVRGKTRPHELVLPQVHLHSLPKVLDGRLSQMLPEPGMAGSKVVTKRFVQGIGRNRLLDVLGQTGGVGLDRTPQPGNIGFRRKISGSRHGSPASR